MIHTMDFILWIPKHDPQYDPWYCPIGQSSRDLLRVSMDHKFFCSFNDFVVVLHGGHRVATKLSCSGLLYVSLPLIQSLDLFCMSFSGSLFGFYRIGSDETVLKYRSKANQPAFRFSRRFFASVWHCSKQKKIEKESSNCLGDFKLKP